jgi:hypothetical protein
MDTVQFFLLHHARLFPEIEDRFSQLTDDQMRLRPHPGMTSIAWLLWHMACGEDMLNRLLTHRPLLLDEEGWLHRLNLSRRDIGTGMTDAEVAELSARINTAALRTYHAAVGRRTQEIARDLRPEDLDVVPDPSRIRQLFQGEGVFGPQARAVEQFYAGKTHGWFLGHLALTHPREHFAQALLVRKMQGLGTGRR